MPPESREKLGVPGDGWPATLTAALAVNGAPWSGEQGPHRGEHRGTSRRVPGTTAHRTSTARPGGARVAGVRTKP